MSLQICGLNRSNTQKELQPHGTAEFPCAAYASRHSDAPADVIPWHWHEELEAVYIIGGTLKLQIPGGEHLLHQGDLVILNVNVLHSAIGHPTGALHSIVFSPFLITGGADTAFYKKYISGLLACPEFTVWQADTDADIRWFSDAFSALEADDFAYEFTVREKLSHLLPEQSRINGIDVLQIQFAVRPRGDFVPVDVIVVQAHEHGLLSVHPELGRQPMGRGGLAGGAGACQHDGLGSPLADHVRHLRKPLFVQSLIHPNQLPDSAGACQLVQIRHGFALHQRTPPLPLGKH